MKYLYKYSFKFCRKSGKIIQTMEMGHAGKDSEKAEDAWVNHELAYTPETGGEVWVRVALTKEEVEALGVLP